MGVPAVPVIMIFAFLMDAVAGAITFTIFRWIAEQSPEKVSMHLGLISALGSLVYFCVCHALPRLGVLLPGKKMPAAGILMGLIVHLLLINAKSVGMMYVLSPAFFGCLGLVFPALTSWPRYGRSGGSLRSVLFIFCLARLSGVTAGAYFGSHLYYLSPGNTGASYVYLTDIAIMLVCLGLLCLPGQKTIATGQITAEEAAEQPDKRLGRAFMYIAWLGNVLLMLCGVVLLNLFSNLATSLQYDARVHGWLVVAFRTSALLVTGLMMVSLFWHYCWWSYLLAQGLGVLGLCLVGWSGDYWVFVLGFVLAGMMMGHNYYAGVYYSLTSVTSSDALGQRNRAAMNESFFSVGSIVGAMLGGLVGAYQIRLPYFLAAGVITAVFVIQMLIFKNAHLPEAEFHR